MENEIIQKNRSSSIEDFRHLICQNIMGSEDIFVREEELLIDQLRGEGSKESKRVLKLLSFDILDTEAEEQFDRITTITASIFNVPICLISLIDTTRQWFKSKNGLDLASTCRDISFCQYAIKHNDVFVVLDATTNDQFKDNPLVTGFPHIAFYAGAPLRTNDGFVLGTLCIIGKNPRNEFSDQDRETLKNLAVLVVEEMEIRKRNEEIRIDREKAMYAEKLKSAFMANMSYEIRNPLTSIIGVIDVLLMEEKVSGDNRDDIKMLKSSCESLHQLLSDILNLSKIESNELMLEPSCFCIEKLITETEKLFQPVAKLKGINLSSCINDPDHIMGRNELFGDYLRIKQVIWNLMGNAVKFTSKGTISIECNIFNSVTAEDAVEVLIKVKDSGIGITADQQKLLFKPFSQADVSTTRKFGGSGLGLSIVMKLVCLMNGAIGVESEEGKGATFWFQIPLGFKLSSKKRNSVGPHLLHFHRQLRVIVAEDNPGIQKMVRRIFSKLGHYVSIFENGRLALSELMSGNEYDIFFCDKQMPEMDGVTTIKLWKQYVHDNGVNSSMSVYFFTADSVNLSESLISSLGVQGVLEKPLTMKKLVDILNNVD